MTCATKHALAEKLMSKVEYQKHERNVCLFWNTRVNFRDLRACDVTTEEFSRDLRSSLQDHVCSAGMKHVVVNTAKVRVIDHRHTSGDFWSYGDVLAGGPIGMALFPPLTVMAFGGEACKKIGHAFRPELEFYVDAENRRPSPVEKKIRRAVSSSMGGTAFSS